MPKSKRSKDHKKRVAARNQKIKTQQNAMQRAFNELLQKEIERRQNELKSNYGITASVGNQDISVEVVNEIPQTNQ